MGCGALDNPQVAENKQSLFSKIRSRILYIKSRQLVKEYQQFITHAEIQAAQNHLTSFHQVLELQELQRFEAGEPFLLSNQRKIIWKLALLNFDRKEKFNNYTYSENPIAQSQSSIQRFYQINLDVGRTFTLIQQLDKVKLTKVLQNLTLYFEGVGYTQGMNFVTGFLLLCGFTAVQTFQVFIKMSYSKYFVLIRNFTQNFQNVNTSIAVLQSVIEASERQSLKLVKLHIENHGLNFFLFIFSWLMTYFSYNCGLKSIILIWDFLILTNLSANIEVKPFEVKGASPQTFGSGLINSLNLSLQILQSLGQKILQCESTQQIMQIIKNDSIQLYLTQSKVYDLISKCKTAPYITWQSFVQIVDKIDPSLSNIIKGKTKKQNEEEVDHFKQFINHCQSPVKK